MISDTGDQANLASISQSQWRHKWVGGIRVELAYIDNTMDLKWLASYASH